MHTYMQDSATWMLCVLQFEESLPHFAASLAVNAMQVGAWFSYGCAAMACEQYELAATAFRRCVTLETEVRLLQNVHVRMRLGTEKNVYAKNTDANTIIVFFHIAIPVMAKFGA